MNGITGLDVLIEAKKTNPKTEFIFLTRIESFDIDVYTIKYGAYDYVIKDRFAFKKILDTIKKIILDQ